MTQEPHFPPESPTYPEASQATTALVLGILGVIGGTAGIIVPFLGFLVLLSPFGWYFGRKEMKAIDSGLRDPAFRGNAKVGMILGIVGTVLMILGIILIVLVIVLFSIYGS